MHAQLGQILDKRYKKTKKAQLSLLKSWEQKLGGGSKTGVLRMPPELNTTKGWANHLSHPSSLTPGPTPTLTTYKEQACPTSGSEQASKATYYLFSLPPAAAETPVKLCLNFLSVL